MPFREKSAWISLVCLIATFGVFFTSMGVGVIPQQGWGAFHHFLLTVVGFIVLQIVLHVIAAILTPKDAGTPVDERERLILLKAGRNGHLVLIVAALATPLSLHFGFNAAAMAYHLMLGLVVSEIVRSTSQIVYFRLGR